MNRQTLHTCGMFLFLDWGSCASFGGGVVCEWVLGCVGGVGLREEAPCNLPH